MSEDNVAFPFLLNRTPQTKVKTALITPTIAITLIPTVASRLATKLTEPLPLFEVDVDEDPLAAGAVGVKTAAALAKHELATALAESEAFELTVPFPAKLHDWVLLVVS
jgi:hypothetical protein